MCPFLAARPLGEGVALPPPIPMLPMRMPCGPAITHSQAGVTLIELFYYRSLPCWLGGIFCLRLQKVGHGHRQHQMTQGIGAST